MEADTLDKMKSYNGDMLSAYQNKMLKTNE